MYGSCWFTRPAVFELETGSGVGSDAAPCKPLTMAFPNDLVELKKPTAVESMKDRGKLEPFSAAAAEA